jgi:hypothetical protein
MLGAEHSLEAERAVDRVSADPTMSVSNSYEEFVPPGVQSIWDTARPLGFGLSGIRGNNAHTYGLHLSAARLQGTGHGSDPTLAPPAGTRYTKAAAAIDLGTGPAGDGPLWAGEWLEDVRRRCQVGEIGFIWELIGDPDLIPGPVSDAHVHLYACAPSWEWVPYTGQGHVAWCHVGIRRDRLADTSLGVRLFAGWNAEGKEEATVADVDKTVRAMKFTVPGHTYDRLDEILPAFGKLIDTMSGPAWRQRLIADVRAAVIAELKSNTAG